MYIIDHEQIKDQWQWVNDDHRWADYPADINQLLVDAKLKQQSTVVFMVGADTSLRKYIVDLKDKVQVNPKTKCGRRVRCVLVYRKG